MPYVKRAPDGRITMVGIEPMDGSFEQVPEDAPDLRAFLAGIGAENSLFEISDLKLIRAIEDVIDLLIQKNVICITDLPPAVQSKLMERRSLRHSLNALKLFGDDEQGTI